MSSKIHMEFMQACYEAFEKLIPCGALMPYYKWYVGGGFKDYVVAQRKIVLMPDAQKLPDSLFGIDIIIDESIAPNIFELRADDGRVVTLEIPEV